MTDARRAVISEIERCEALGLFDEHTSPPDYSLSLPVDERYDYLRTSFKSRVQALPAKAVTFFAEKMIIRNLFDLAVVGELPPIPHSLVVCNHIHMFDCVIVRHAFARKNIFITAAEFNNRSDFLGYLMRNSGMMPFSRNLSAMKNLNRAVKTIFSRPQGHILIFPEASEWLYYKEPRPFKSGAFHFAAVHSVPVLPMFITLSEFDRLDKNGDPKPKATLHILDPIYPEKGLATREQCERFSKLSRGAMLRCFEQVYGNKLHIAQVCEK